MPRPLIQFVTAGVIWALVIGTAGCVQNHLVLSHQQRALISKQNAYLSKYASDIDAAMQRDGTRSALVILHGGTTQPPDILPTDNPISTLANKSDSLLKDATGCVLFSRSDIPVTPQPLNCGLLTSLTQNYVTDSAREKQQNASIEQIQGQLVTIRADLDNLAQQNKSLESELRSNLKTLEDALSKQSEDARWMRGVIGSTTKIVYLQQAEMKELKKSLKMVLDGYQQSIQVVGKNNEQIDKIAADLNNSMNSITTQINDMKQKLDTIAK